MRFGKGFGFEIGPGFVGLGLSLFCLMMGLVPPRVTQPVNALSAESRGGALTYQRPTRVAVIAPVLEAYAAIDGGLDDVAAVSQFTASTAMRGAFGAIFPQLQSLPLLGGPGATADPELVLWRRPDLLIIWQWYADVLREIGYPHLLELSLGPPAHPLTPDPNDSSTNFRILASVSDRTARATRLWTELTACRAFVESDVREHVSMDSTVRVLPMYVTETGNIWMGPHNYLQNTLLEDIRAYNPASDQVFTEWGADPELALKLDPDVIVMLTYSFDDELDDGRQPGWWRALRAVRTRHVYLEPDSALNVLDPVDQTLAEVWLAEVAHPSLPHWTRNAYRAILANAYHYHISESELNRALFVNANRNAVGYARFAAGAKHALAGPCGV